MKIAEDALPKTGIPKFIWLLLKTCMLKTLASNILSKWYLVSLIFLMVCVMTSQWLQNCTDDDDLATKALSKGLFDCLDEDVNALFKGFIKWLTW